MRVLISDRYTEIKTVPSFTELLALTATVLALIAAGVAFRFYILYRSAIGTSQTLPTEPRQRFQETNKAAQPPRPEEPKTPTEPPLKAAEPPSESKPRSKPEQKQPADDIRERVRKVMFGTEEPPRPLKKEETAPAPPTSGRGKVVSSNTYDF